jgi:hypothetical protein
LAAITKPLFGAWKSSPAKPFHINGASSQKCGLDDPVGDFRGTRSDKLICHSFREVGINGRVIGQRDDRRDLEPRQRVIRIPLNDEQAERRRVGPTSSLREAIEDELQHSGVMLNSTHPIRRREFPLLALLISFRTFVEQIFLFILRNCFAVFDDGVIPLPFSPSDELKFELHFSNAGWVEHGLGRFRLSVSVQRMHIENQRRRVEALKIDNPWVRLGGAYHYLGDRNRMLDAFSRAFQCRFAGKTGH